jgi:hypothetical protein
LLATDRPQTRFLDGELGQLHRVIALDDVHNRYVLDGGPLPCREPLGYVGYFSDLSVYDLAALVSPEYVDLKQTGWPARHILDRRPSFLVVRQFEIPSNAFLADPGERLFASGSDRERLSRESSKRCGSAMLSSA